MGVGKVCYRRFAGYAYDGVGLIGVDCMSVQVEGHASRTTKQGDTRYVHVGQHLDGGCALSAIRRCRSLGERAARLNDRMLSLTGGDGHGSSGDIDLIIVEIQPAPG